MVGTKRRFFQLCCNCCCFIITLFYLSLTIFLCNYRMLFYCPFLFLFYKSQLRQCHGLIVGVLCKHILLRIWTSQAETSHCCSHQWRHLRFFKRFESDIKYCCRSTHIDKSNRWPPLNSQSWMFSWPLLSLFIQNVMQFGTCVVCSWVQHICSVFPIFFWHFDIFKFDIYLTFALWQCSYVLSKYISWNCKHQLPGN